MTPVDCPSNWALAEVGVAPRQMVGTRPRGFGCEKDTDSPYGALHGTLRLAVTPVQAGMVVRAFFRSLQEFLVSIGGHGAPSFDAFLSGAP